MSITLWVIFIYSFACQRLIGFCREACACEAATLWTDTDADERIVIKLLPQQPNSLHSPIRRRSSVSRWFPAHVWGVLLLLILPSLPLQPPKTNLGSLSPPLIWMLLQNEGPSNTSMFLRLWRRKMAPSTGSPTGSRRIFGILGSQRTFSLVLLLVFIALVEAVGK